MKHSFNATLGQLFPSDIPASAWLFQLAVIHDDITYEAINLHRSTESWEQGYFLRRMSLGLAEAVNIVERHLSDRAFEEVTGMPAKESNGLADLRKTIKETKTALREMRHRIGGHFDPANVVKGQPAPPKDSMQKHLRTHADWQGEMSLDSKMTGELGDFSFRGLSAISVLLVWPDTVDDESLKKRIHGSYGPIAELGGKLTRAIQYLLVANWKRRDVLPLKLTELPKKES